MADINQNNNSNNSFVTLYNQSNSNPFNELLFGLKKEQNNSNQIMYIKIMKIKKKITSMLQKKITEKLKKNKTEKKK